MKEYDNVNRSKHTDFGENATETKYIVAKLDKKANTWKSVVEERIQFLAEKELERQRRDCEIRGRDDEFAIFEHKTIVTVTRL